MSFTTKLRGLVNLSQNLWGNEQTNGLDPRLTPEAGALRSSLEIPRETIEEFRAWKSRQPIPVHPLVTVIVTTYNRAHLLIERSIPSILKQTYKNFELIVVGDGCTDNTAEALSQIKDRRLRFHNLPERGHYPLDPMHRWMVAGTAPANEALSLAQGDFITHLDDDDEHTPDRLEKLVKFAVAKQCDFVWHPFWWMPKGKWRINQAEHLAHGQVTNGAVFYRSWFTNIKWNANAYQLSEPADWNRYRRVKYIAEVIMRYPEPLLKHHRENRPDVD